MTEGLVEMEGRDDAHRREAKASRECLASVWRARQAAAGFPMSVAMAMLAFSLLAFSGEATAGPDSTSVDVQVVVDPIAQIDFPEGPGFVLHVPDRVRCDRRNDRRQSGHRPSREEDDKCRRGKEAWWWPAIPPVWLPFTVKGNALATVSVSPDRFQRLRNGRYLGRAVDGRGRKLGYNIIVEFPATGVDRHWPAGRDDRESRHGRHVDGPWSWRSRTATLPGRDGVGTRELTADMVRRRGQTTGVIYLVAERTWTPSGRPAEPGDYRGTVRITLTAENR